MAADAPSVVALAQPVAVVVEPARVAGVAIAAGGQGPPGRDGAPGGTTFEWSQDIPLAVWTAPTTWAGTPASPSSTTSATG